MEKLNNINVVIGSWGSYNACNEKALGSKWICLNDYNTWDEIIKELENEGFDLNGIDEELFIQDIEYFISDEYINWDSVNPMMLFNLLKNSGILDNEYKYKIAVAYCKVESFSQWEDEVNKNGDRWDDDIYIWEDINWKQLGIELVSEYYGDIIPDDLSSYIDYEAYAKNCDGFSEYESNIIGNGIIEIRY